MASIQTGIQLNDGFTSVINSIIGSVSLAVSAMESMRGAMNADIDTSALEGARMEINQATMAVNQLEQAMSGVAAPTVSPQMDMPEISRGIKVDVVPVVPEPLISEQAREAVTVPAEVTVESGQRIAGITSRLEGISRMQQAISDTAKHMYVLPDKAAAEISGISREIARMEQALKFLEENPFNLDSSVAELQIESISVGLDELAAKQQKIDGSLGNIPSQIIHADIDVPDPLIEDPAPVRVPLEWQTDSLDVFTGSGMERFRQEVQSTDAMLQQLCSTQDAIAKQAYNTSIFPPDAFRDLNSMAVRIDSIRDRIQQIESNPMNIGADAVNSELEQTRAQLNQIVSIQDELKAAVDGMDVSAANDAYLRLSQTVSGTERYLRDNVDEQGRFNREIDRGVSSAGNLRSMIARAVGAFAGLAGIRKAISWIEECTEAFDTQRNAELQLMTVLANTVEAEVEVDASGAIAEINDIRNQADGVTLDVSPDTSALQGAFDAITAKASEIQSKGIYGDEAMIAGAAEFSTYFSDTEAIEMMMDTLTDYAMGMSGGGALDAKAMVDYATGLGKIMSGSYDAMTKKGFEFTEAQKAVIEGTASQEQIISAIGEEYLDASADIQAAAAINAVIAESWDGLYESMSDTPEGKIIQMTNAWGDMKEVVGSQLYPYVVRFVDVITENWPTIQRVVDGITGGLQLMMVILSWLLEGAFNFAQVVIDNWSWISPVIYGIIAALAFYGVYLGIVKGIEIASAVGAGILAVGKGLLAAATMIATGATWAETKAQMGLNGAMYACPIVWIVILVIALVAAFYAAIAAINKFAGTSISATGVICGVFASWVAFVINRFIMIYNYVMSLVEWFANVWNDPVYSTKRLFVNLAEMILDFCIAATEGFDDVATNLANAFISGANLAIEGINWIIDALNMIPGVDIGNIGELDKVASITSSLRGVRDDLENWLGEKPDSYVEYDRLDYITIGDAWDAGYSFGEGVEEKITKLFHSEDNYMKEFGGDVYDIADDTGAIRDALDVTQEDLKYLRDIAEQEAVNRFTLAEVKVEQTNHNNISSGMDLDGVVSGLTDAVSEAVDSITEGVHE